MGVNHGDDQEDGAVVVGSPGSDELEAKTQANTHPHLTRRRKKKEEVQEMSLRYGIIYEKWNGDTLQAWMRSEVYVMMRVVASQRRKSGDDRRKKSVAAKATKWTWRRWRLRMRKSCGEEWKEMDFQERTRSYGGDLMGFLEKKI